MFLLLCAFFYFVLIYCLKQAPSVELRMLPGVSDVSYGEIRVLGKCHSSMSYVLLL